MSHFIKKSVPVSKILLLNVITVEFSRDTLLSVLLFVLPKTLPLF